jgi:hypothetical protein
MRKMIKVVTVATDLEHPFLQRLLVKSCAALGLPLVILKPRDSGEWRGFITKKTLLLRYLESVQDRDELLMFVDGYDTVIVRGPRQIAEAHADCGAPILFGGETNSWPLGAVGCVLYGERAEGRFPYLNSGGFVGRASWILDLMRRYPETPIDRFPELRSLESHGYDLLREYGWSDQFYWTLVHLLERDEIAVDHEARVFEYLGPVITDVVVREVLALNEAAERKWRKSRLQRKETRRIEESLRTPATSAVLHFAGKVSSEIVLDLDRRGRLPGWLREVIETERVAGGPEVLSL